MQTRIFELAPSYGYPSLAALARAMGVSTASLSRLRAKRVAVSVEVIAGSRRAFPDQSLDALFPRDDLLDGPGIEDYEVEDEPSESVTVPRG